MQLLLFIYEQVQPVHLAIRSFLLVIHKHIFHIFTTIYIIQFFQKAKILNNSRRRCCKNYIIIIGMESCWGRVQRIPHVVSLFGQIIDFGVQCRSFADTADTVQRILRYCGSFQVQLANSSTNTERITVLFSKRQLASNIKLI